MTEPIITVNGLTKEYFKRSPLEARYETMREKLTSFAKPKKSTKKNDDEIFKALDDISLSIDQGEVVGVIGRNGAGKSTLLKILSRITAPSSGEIILNGRVGSLLEVGTGFHPELSGRENIFMNGAILGMDKQEINAKLDEIIDFAGVADFIDMPVKRYSSGMRMRLAFAVAAHLEPEILIIDEVLAVGDYEFQKKCLGTMQDVSKSGRTVIFVSHNMNMVRQLCNRGIYLRNGKIQKDSKDIDEVVSEYISYESDAKTQWNAEDDDIALDDPVFKPSRLFLSQGKDIVVGPVFGDEETQVNIEFDLIAKETALSVGYALYDSMGALIYWSYFTDNAETRLNLKQGKNQLVSNLPSNILNDGDYRLVLIAGIQGDRPVYRMDTSPIAITISVQGHRNRSNYWSGRRHSLIAPVIKWQNA